MSFIKKLRNGFKINLTGDEAEKMIHKLFSALAKEDIPFCFKDWEIKGWTMNSTMEGK